MLTFVQCFLSPFLCGFREGYSVQHALLSIVEFCKKSLNIGGVAGVVMMDLSKAVNCLNHELPIAKLDPHFFSSIAIFITGSRGLKLMALLVHGQKLS